MWLGYMLTPQNGSVSHPTVEALDTRVACGTSNPKKSNQLWNLRALLLGWLPDASLCLGMGRVNNCRSHCTCPFWQIICWILSLSLRSLQGFLLPFFRCATWSAMIACEGLVCPCSKKKHLRQYQGTLLWVWNTSLKAPSFKHILKKTLRAFAQRSSKLPGSHQSLKSFLWVLGGSIRRIHRQLCQRWACISWTWASNHNNRLLGCKEWLNDLWLRWLWSSWDF